jgi:hypothetical protein
MIVNQISRLEEIVSTRACGRIWCSALFVAAVESEVAIGRVTFFRNFGRFGRSVMGLRTQLHCQYPSHSALRMEEQGSYPSWQPAHGHRGYDINDQSSSERADTLAWISD